jgi:hypothetical protein
MYLGKGLILFSARPPYFFYPGMGRDVCQPITLFECRLDGRAKKGGQTRALWKP